MKKWLKIGFSSVLILILMFSLAACNSTDKTDSEKIEKVRLVEVTRSIFYAPEYVAIAKGFFEEEGLELLEKWEKEGASMLLGSDKNKIIAKANNKNDVLDLNAPPITVNKEERGGNQYDSFFDQ